VTKRSPGTVLLFSLLTLGIYGLYWAITTKNEMMAVGGPPIPSGWSLLLVLIPIVGIIWIFMWYWKWAAGVEHVTGGKMSQVMAFICIVLLNQIFFLGGFVIQSELNKAIDRGAAGQLPQARVA
jgi:hypothetical protein